MNRKMVFPSILLTFAVSFSILIIANFNTGSTNSIFAKNLQLGANSSPIVADDFTKKLNDAYNRVAEAALKSVVNLDVEVKYETQIPKGMEEFFRHFGVPEEKGGTERRRMGGGSGVIISNDGYIVTNNHVIDNAVDGGITVTTTDKKTFTAKVIGTDPLTDLALIKIDAKGLQPAHFADIDDVKIGNIVLAVGSPLGLNATVTNGIVSAIARGRLGIIGRQAENRSYSIENFIQTDAPINPGNSGGGLFDINGSLVGINTAIASQTGSYIGYGFAIPIDLVKSVISDLLEDGKVNRGYIGVQINQVDQKLAKALGMNEVKGVLVDKVMPNSAGELAGLESGDIILKVDSKEVNSPGELQNQVGLRRAGDEISLSIWRNKKEITKKVVLKGKDGEDISSNSNISEKDITSFNFEKLGFKVETIPASLKEKTGIENGVIVSDVTPYSEAHKSGLSKGVIITKADRKEISSPKQFKEIVDKLNEGDAFLLQVYFDDVSRLIALEIPTNPN
jgi:serine protease Do